MAWFYTTIGAVATTVPITFHTELESVTITSVGASILRGTHPPASVSCRFGFTAPGDEDVQIYTLLGSGVLSASDGLLWNGSIRFRSPVFLCLQYTATGGQFILLSWSSTT